MGDQSHRARGREEIMEALRNALRIRRRTQRTESQRRIRLVILLVLRLWPKKVYAWGEWAQASLDRDAQLASWARLDSLMALHVLHDEFVLLWRRLSRKRQRRLREQIALGWQ